MRAAPASILMACLLLQIGPASAARRKAGGDSFIKNGQIDLSVYGPWKDGSRRVRPWSKVVGERVVAEGLAWGVCEKGLGQRVILDYGHVYVDGVDLANGKLMRVVGTLRLGRVDAAPKGAQGYGEAFQYFYIKAEKAELIDEVRAPCLAEPGDDKQQ